MNDYTGYEKMPSSLKKLGLDAKAMAELDKLKWAVTEKIHGANFSFLYEASQLKFAKRKSLLSWKDDFFGFQLVVREWENRMLQLFEDLNQRGEFQKMMVFGELFGGKYPHPDVESVDSVQAIQTGVYYAPWIHFCAFDIALETSGPESRVYLNYEKAVSLFEKHGIFHVKPLFIGKLSEAMDFNIRMNSTLPAQFGLPELQENLIEGVVIKPYTDYDPERIPVRPILKMKNPEFEEEAKFHQAEKWSFIPEISSNAEELSFLLEELRNYVTANRLESAVSKIGAMNAEIEGRIAEIEGEAVRDALFDFDENNDGLLNELSVEQMDWVKERLRAVVRQLMVGG